MDNLPYLHGKLRQGECGWTTRGMTIGREKRLVACAPDAGASSGGLLSHVRLGFSSAHHLPFFSLIKKIEHLSCNIEE